MKNFLFILSISIMTISFYSCNLNSTENYTPQIGFRCINLTSGDTLRAQLTNNGNELLLDSTQVGDTILLGFYLNGIANNLTTFNYTISDTASMKSILPEESALESVFSKEESDFEKGTFTFLPKEKNVFFPLRIVSLKKDPNASISVLLISDAVFEKGGYNTSTLRIKTPIKTKI